MNDDPNDRGTWAFPAVVPHRIWDYPVPALMPAGGHQGGTWPDRPMDHGVRRFEERTSALPKVNFLYVHVPYCPFHCSFCGFYTKTDHRSKPGFVDLLLREIRLVERHVPRATDREYDFVYFGGGTPSELQPDELVTILDHLRSAFPVARDAEVTLEGVAEQMTREGFLKACRDGGFTRIAFGIQSLDPAVRAAIGRGRESVEAFPELVAQARGLGMASNVEIMMACPQQTLESLRSDLQQVVEWGANSIDVSAYVMIPGTNLYSRVLRGVEGVQPRYGGELLAMRQLVTETLSAAGYRAARAESWALDDRRFDISCGTSIGNGLFTQVALGPSAHGHVDGTVYANVADLERYRAAVEAGCLPVGSSQRMTLRQARTRALLDAIGGLFVPDVLLERGADRARFEAWCGAGLVERVDGGYQLTERGLHWENQLQLAVLGFGNAFKGMRMLGSYEDQLALVRQGGSVGRELVEQAGNGSAVRKAGYRVALSALRHAPGLDKRAVGLLGPVTGEPR